MAKRRPRVPDPDAPDLTWAPEDLTPAEVRWLSVLLGRLRQQRGLTLGTFAEAVVALELPGALHSPGGTDRYDLTWRGIKIEVKASRNNRWEIKPAWGRDENGTKVRRLWADVWVIAMPDGPDHRGDWSFYVMPRHRLEGHTSDTLRLRLDHLRGWGLKPVTAKQLPRAVGAAHRDRSP